jgi:hypothetical protein
MKDKFNRDVVLNYGMCDVRLPIVFCLVNNDHYSKFFQLVEQKR